MTQNDQTYTYSLKKKSSPRISVKLLIFMASFTAVIIVLLWLTQIVFLSDIYEGIKLSEINEAASELSSLSKTPIRLEEKANDIALKYDICIIGYRVDKLGKATQFLSCDTLNNCLIHRLSQPDLLSFYKKAVLNGGKISTNLYFDAKSGTFTDNNTEANENSPKSLVYAFIKTDIYGNDMFFLLNSFVSPVNSTVKTLNYLLIIISSVMVILSCILTFVLSRSITKPISDMSKSAEMLAQGSYDVTFNGGTYKEANELASSLNYAASELSKTEQLRSELIANVSHDLRTPLTMISGYAELMRDIPSENTPENAQVIIDESKRLTSLVNDMLDISKLENGTPKVNNETFNLTFALRTELEGYNDLCKKEGFTIKFNYNGDITVTTDRSKFLQALINLVNNALTYTGDDKLVTVSQDVYTDNKSGINYVRVSVIDTGAGIPQDKLDLIWDRYYKLNTAHKRAENGSGLGLSIVKKIISLLGGRCGVMSSQNSGSIFFIEIPL